jgi:hypothetical protein
MPKFDTPFAAKRYRDKRHREREALASIYPDDKLRVRPTHYQTVATRTGKQILKFRPTDVIDDPHRIRIMDELGVSYVVLSVPPEDLEQEPEPEGDTTDPTVALGEGGPSTALTLTTIAPSTPSTASTIVSIPNALALATVPLVLATVPPAAIDALKLASLPNVEAEAGTIALASISPAALATIPDVEHDETTKQQEPEPEGDWEPKG